MTKEHAPAEEKIVSVPWNVDGKRFDAAAQILSRDWFSPELPRSYLQSAIEAGTILLAGKQAFIKARVSKSDKVTFTEAFFTGVVASQQRVFPSGEEPRVLYRHTLFIALYKPALWLTHEVSSYQKEATLEDWLIEKELISTDLPNNGRVHRLDRNTSGVLLYAKNADTQETLQRLFQERAITKTYIALVEGNILEHAGTIDAPISRKKGSFKRMIAQKGENNRALISRPAQTRYKVIAECADKSLILAYPLTGRTHQIRLHLQHLGHPIVGDGLYGKESPLVTHQFLHAWNLSFSLDKEQFSITCPLPEDLKQVLRTLDDTGFTRYDNEALKSIGLKHKVGFFSLSSLFKKLLLKSS